MSDYIKMDDSTHSSDISTNDNDTNTNIELNIEDIFINLRLISKIEVGNKLVQTDKYVNIDTSYLPSLTRWYNGSNRNETIKFMSLIFDKAFEINDKLLSLKTDESVQTLLRLGTELKNTIIGLSNLKQTYSNDKLIQSEIDVMMDNIQTKLDNNLKSLNLNRSPNKKH